MDDEQLANVFGALALHIADRIDLTTALAASHGAAAPAALVSVYNHPKETIDYLSRVLNLSHSGTVRLVDRLVEDGLLLRAGGSDGRSVALACTPAGRKRAAKILSARREVTMPLVSALSVQQKRQLSAILHKVPWIGVDSKIEALKTCRLCDETRCVDRNCPVSEARKASHSPQQDI